jgi:hypothetical protein
MNDEAIITMAGNPAKNFCEHAMAVGLEEDKALADKVVAEMRAAMENLILQMESAIRSGKRVEWNFSYPTRPCRPSGSNLIAAEHEHTGETIVTIHVRPH